MHDLTKPDVISEKVTDLIGKTSASLSSDTLKKLLQRNNLISCFGIALRWLSPYLKDDNVTDAGIVLLLSANARVLGGELW